MIQSARAWLVGLDCFKDQVMTTCEIVITSAVSQGCRLVVQKVEFTGPTGFRQRIRNYRECQSLLTRLGTS